MVARNDAAMEITDKEFKEVINNSNKIVVVDFFAEWCMPCLMLSPIIEDLAQELKEVKFVRINIDDNEELASKYNIISIPCLVIFKQGNVIDKIIGGRPSEVIEEKIRQYL